MSENEAQIDDSLYAIDNPDFDWSDDGEQTTEQADNQPAETEAPTADDAEPPAQPAGDQDQAQPQVPDQFGEVAKAIRESERARAQAEADAAYQRGIQEAFAYAQRQQMQQPIEPPDPIVDPEGYREYVRQSVLQEVSPHIEGLKTQLLMAEAGVPVETLQQAYQFVAERQPYIIAGLNHAPNPYKALMDHAKVIGFGGGETTPTQTDQPAATAIPDHIRQQVLKEEAARLAAAGATPQTKPTLPRGVGTLPNAQGMSDKVPPPSEWGRIAAANPAQWEQIQSSVLSMPGGAF